MTDVQHHVRVFVQGVQLLVMLRIVTILAIQAVILVVQELVTELVLEDVVVILGIIDHFLVYRC